LFDRVGEELTIGVLGVEGKEVGGEGGIGMYRDVRGDKELLGRKYY